MSTTSNLTFFRRRFHHFDGHVGAVVDVDAFDQHELALAAHFCARTRNINTPLEETHTQKSPPTTATTTTTTGGKISETGRSIHSFTRRDELGLHVSRTTGRVERLAISATSPDTHRLVRRQTEKSKKKQKEKVPPPPPPRPPPPFTATIFLRKPARSGCWSADDFIFFVLEV